MILKAAAAPRAPKAPKTGLDDFLAAHPERLICLINVAPPVFPPPPPPWEPDPEHAAAWEIALSRRDQTGHRCPRPRQLVLKDKRSGKPVLIARRCDKWDCPGCKGHLVDRELISARHHMDAAAGLHSGACDACDWPALQKRIRRAGGEYLKARRDHGYLVVATCALAGLDPTTCAAALGDLRDALDAWQGPKRPVSTSRGWKLPRGPKSGRYTRLGQASPDITPEDVEKAAADVGAVATKVQADDPLGPVSHTWAFERLEGWPEPVLRRLVSNLVLGGVVEDLGRPPPEPPREWEVPAMGDVQKIGM